MRSDNPPRELTSGKSWVGGWYENGPPPPALKGMWIIRNVRTNKGAKRGIKDVRKLGGKKGRAKERATGRKG